MTIAQDIIQGQMPEFEAYLRMGETLDDIDEYGFTPLIECAIMHRTDIAERLITYKVDINKPDVTGRTPLHWAVDNNDLDMVRLLLTHGANANAFTRNGLSILVYPVLRGQEPLKNLLYHHGAKLDFAQDFIHAKLLGHRFELSGDVDIVNTENEFIEVDYEGFMLEFTVAVVKDALRRFTSSYSTRHLRDSFLAINHIIDGFTSAAELLQYQHQPKLSPKHLQRIAQILQEKLLILPAASRGHALCFIRLGSFWAKVDRGENSLKEGSAIIYKMNKPEAVTTEFIQNFLYKKQKRNYFHQTINTILGLDVVAHLPISSQISGNCSWANVQAIIPVACAMLELEDSGNFDGPTILNLYNTWIEWDKDRALDECIGRFYLASPQRKASIASMLGAVLFQNCSYENIKHLERAEKILNILTLPDYYYVLKSYLDEYCVKRLTKKGNNLLKILEDSGVNSNISINPMMRSSGE